MRKSLLFAVIIALGFITTQGAFADCVDTGDTMSGGNIINCPPPVQIGPLGTATTPNTTIMGDEVTVLEGGGIDASGTLAHAIDANSGNNVITTSGDLTSGTGRSAILTLNDNDMITVNGGRLVSDFSSVVFAGPGADTIVINGGIFDGSATSNPNIQASSGNDTVILNGGTFIQGTTDEVINTSSDEDLIVINANNDLNGVMQCGTEFDTILFQMDVPEQAVGFISSQINTAQVPNGSITINGIFYQWRNCELLVPNLTGVNNVRPIPTLSEWGLIAMAGVLGIIGFIAIRRRTAAN